jgi:hypothetical protein
MSDYVLEVGYSEDEPPIRIELNDYTAEDAEIQRQSLAREIEHALEIEAPRMTWSATGDAPGAGVTIDPTRVTRVDLVDRDADAG